jgi:predicted dehydrogenase
MKKYKVAFIGTGGRSVAYARHYAKNEEIEIVALCDPSGSHRKAMAMKSGLTQTYAEYNNFLAMLREKPDLDGVVIASPNHLHAEHAVPCLERGLPIALEKPLATSMDDCEKIIDAEAANKGRVILGFVLRSTPFYSKIFELIASETIGCITAIQADELPGLGVTSIMNRSSWRRVMQNSGGAMLEKCCHDMDVFNWLIGSRPSALNSFGSKLIFTKKAAAPDQCDECSQAESCQYYMKPTFSFHEDDGEETMHEFMRQKNLCIYNINSEVPDTQSVNIEYENGAIVNFMLNFNCEGPKASRNFYAIGSMGRIWGNLHDAIVFHYDNHSGKTVSYDCTGDGSGHSGGDKLHALQLLKMMKEPEYYPKQNAKAGYMSAAMCFAADYSMQKKKRIIFHYEQSGKISYE